MSYDITPDARKRYKETSQYKEKVKGIKKFYKAKYQTELTQSNVFWRLFLVIKMEIEIKREIKKLTSLDQMFFTKIS